ARSARAVRSKGSCARKRSCGQSPPLVLGERNRRAHVVVVPDQHALRSGDPPVAGPDLVVEGEALRADVRAAAAHLDLLARAQLGLEVDLDTGEDERLEPAEDPETRL